MVDHAVVRLSICPMWGRARGALTFIEHFSGLFTQMWKPHDFLQGWVVMPSFYRWRNRGAKSQRCAGHRGPKARRLDLSLGLSNSRSHSLSIYTKPSISHKENSVSNSLHTRQALNLSLAIYFPAFLLRNVPIVTTLEEYFCLVFVSN